MDQEIRNRMVEQMQTAIDTGLEGGMPPLNVYGNLAERIIAAFVLEMMSKGLTEDWPPNALADRTQEMVERIVTNAYGCVDRLTSEINQDAQEPGAVLPVNVTQLH